MPFALATDWEAGALNFRGPFSYELVCLDAPGAIPELLVGEICRVYHGSGRRNLAKESSEKPTLLVVQAMCLGCYDVVY